MALEMLEFIDSRLFASRVAWNGPVPEYQVLVRRRVDALDGLRPQGNAAEHDRVREQLREDAALAANCWRYFSALESGAEVRDARAL
jgi:hypothetical protein